MMLGTLAADREGFYSASTRAVHPSGEFAQPMRRRCSSGWHERRVLWESYGRTPHGEAVAGVDVRIERGEVLAFVGPNGAGTSITWPKVDRLTF
jgi:ABC-type multidrug transport system fused ATPase/permease subunit